MLSIVMPVFNEGKCLDLTLQSLQNQELEKDRFEVVLVDDGSREDLAPVVDKNRGLDIKYIRNPRNSGRAFSRNVGIRNAGGDVVFFLDSDSFAHPGLLKHHHDFHEETGKKRVLLGSRHEINWKQLGQIVKTGRVDHSTLTIFEDDLRASLIEQRYQSLYLASGWILAYTHNMSVPKDILLRAGMFDENLKGWGLEDGELAYRISHMDKGIDGFTFRKEAVCYHLPHMKNLQKIGLEYFQNQNYIRNKYNNFEMEIYFLGVPDCVKKMRYYAEMTGFCRETGFGAFDKAVIPALKIKENSRVLLIASNTSSALDGITEKVKTIDYGRPISGDNPHFIGMNTTFANQEFDKYVCVDTWRLLIWNDLSQFIAEGIRISSEIIFIYTKAPPTVPPLGSCLSLINDLDYLFHTMKNHLKVEILFENDDFVAFSVGEY
jgi:glycosyltransferase involved in cell wall biosynthesis